MTRQPLHVVGILDHSDHRATPRCPCRPEPCRDLAEPSVSVYVHARPVLLIADVAHDKRAGRADGDRAPKKSGGRHPVVPKPTHARTDASLCQPVFRDD